MTLDEYIYENHIKPADVIVVKKKWIGLLDHYLVYLGQHYGEHKFIANYTGGVRILNYQELSSYAESLYPERIRRFTGNDIQREAAVTRALSRVDQSSYDLILNNCEHYANFVQQGEAYSNQTKVFGTGLAIAGMTTALSAKNNPGKETFGWVMAGLGLLTLIFDEKK
jgi:hypothetical protein